MKIIQFFYRTIYNQTINYFLRNGNKKLNFIIPTKIKIPPSGIIKLETDSGNIKIATNQTSYLTKLLFWNSYKKFEYSEIFEVLSKKIDSFFDIGANIGYYSLLASKSNPSIKVFAFEPATGPKYYLNKNILLNNMEQNIIPVYYALSKNSSEIDFYEVKSAKYNYLDKNLSGEHNTGTKTKTRNFIKTVVQSERLSTFIEKNKIESIDLIKIDTEGTEVEILESGTYYIESFNPIVICETLFNTTETELTTFFKNLNYEFYNHTSNGLEKVETLERSVDNGVRNCFFVPKNKKHLISEFIFKN